MAIVRPKTPFSPGERRQLVVEAAELAIGPVDAVAQHRLTRQWPTHEARHYELGLPDLDVHAQLNHGDAGEDEGRLRRIAVDLLTPPPPGI